MEAVHLGPPKRLAELPGGKVATAEVAHLALIDQFAQRRQRFVHGRVFVKGVDLVEVDHVGLQAAQTRLDGLGNPFGGQRRDQLGRQHHLVAFAALLDPTANDRFRPAFVVGFGGVDQVDAPFQGVIDNRKGRRLVDLAAKGDRAQTNRADFEISTAKLSIFHDNTPVRTQ